jgi:hypothetical protein
MSGTVKKSKSWFVAFAAMCRRSGDRFQVGERFSPPFRTVRMVQSAPFTLGTMSFPGVKRPGRGIDYPRPPCAVVKERVELYTYSPSGPSRLLIGWPLPFYLFVAMCYIFHMTRSCKTHIPYCSFPRCYVMNFRGGQHFPLFFAPTMKDMYSSATLVPLKSLLA